MIILFNHTFESTVLAKNRFGLISKQGMYMTIERVREREIDRGREKERVTEIFKFIRQKYMK